MFLPRSVRCDDFETLHKVVQDMCLGTLITHNPNGEAVVDHVPFILEPPGESNAHGVLYTHVARANAHWQTLISEQAVVAFSSPGAYIAPHYYESYKPGARHVPTFYYVAVHAHGELLLHEDPAWLITHLERLSAQFERSNNPPWMLEDAEQTYRTNLLSGIVGVEIKLSKPLVGKFKLGQNRSLADRQSVLHMLEQGHPLEQHIASYLERSLGEEF